MLFRKKIEPLCAYCGRGIQLNETQVLCRKQGVVPATHRCGSFSYDPLRREPPVPAAPHTDHLKEEDFAL